MSNPGEEQRWRVRRGTPQQNPPNNNNSQQSQQGQRRNQSRDGNPYQGGYQGGGGGGGGGGSNREGGNAWNNRGGSSQGQNQQQQQQQQQQSQQHQQQQQAAFLLDEHVPVRGFNSREVSEFLNREYTAALNTAQNPYENDASKKPMIYKSPEKPWKTTGRTSGGPWGSKQHVMANGTDFLSQLRKGWGSVPPANKE